MVNPQEREGSTQPLDEEVSQRIERIVQEKNYLLRDILEAFPLYVRRIHLARFIARYELYKMIQDVPGCIFECGVYRGTGLMTWAKIVEIFSPGDRLKKVIGFDSFQGFASLHEKDGQADEKVSKVVGGCNPARYYDELLEHIDIFHKDSYVPRAPRIEIVAGDIKETAPRFIEQNPGVRISLLNLDVDLYEPTLAALEHFYPLVVPGGMVILDEYNCKMYGGEPKAWEEYFAGKKRTPTLKKLPVHSYPGAYYIKE